MREAAHIFRSAHVTKHTEISVVV